MKHRRLAPIVAAAALALMAAPAAPAMAQSAAPAAKSATVMEVKRASIACTSPSGQKTNYSWGTGSLDSTTVYFNNHCSHKVSAKLNFKTAGGQTATQCLTTNGGTSGNKKFWMTRYQLISITKGC